jgi:uncharacterized membrane protein
MGNRFFPGQPFRHEAWGLGIFHLIFMIVVLAAIVALGVWLVSSIRRPQVAPAPAGSIAGHRPLPPTDAALHEARMRYARGEMTREEFVQVSTDLGGAPGALPLQPPE